MKREELSKKSAIKEDLEGRVRIARNQLSDQASDLARKRIHVAALNQGLENQMQRLDAAKNKAKATQAQLDKEIKEQNNLDQMNKNCDENFKEANNMMIEVEKDIHMQKEILFDQTQDLFEKREEQANLIGSISACLSTS